MARRSATAAIVLAGIAVVSLTLCLGQAESAENAPAVKAKAAKPPRPGRKPMLKISPEVRKALGKKVTVKFDATGFEEVVQWMRDNSGLNIHVKWRVLANAGTTRSTEVSVRLKDVGFKRALRLVLHDMPIELDFVVEENVVIISTKDDFRRPAQNKWEQEHEELERAAEMAKLERKIALERIPVEHAEKMEMHMELIERMQGIAFEPGAAGLIAIGAIKDDVRRGPAEIAKHLERLLAKTKSTGLRNGIRMTLKDMYKQMGQKEKVLAHLEAMLAENDRALQEQRPEARE